MIISVDHIAIIVSDEECVGFYKALGFVETGRIIRSSDTIVFLECNGLNLEIFVDPTHPKRATNPENLGLRHFALKVDNVKEFVSHFPNIEVKKDWHGYMYAFIQDPDGQTIEIHE